MLAIAPNLDLVLRDIGANDIRPHFQPIVDLFTATVAGHETLSRGPAPFESPSMLFGRARLLGLTAELEHACHSAAFSRIAAFAGAGRPWFVNVTPEVFCELDGAATAASVRAYGLDPADIVFEITERDVVIDHDALHRAIRAHVAEGFRIALDDFGSGSNGLVALAAGVPHIIKLDMELTRGVHANPYKQSIVRSVVSLAASVDARLIAEGVETWPELETLIRLNVRFAQGRLLGEPQAEPHPLAAGVKQRLLSTVSR
jgi:EAL domain-containing protein (putative c-di-GMP-specific phosphodiesterase class I)